MTLLRSHVKNELRKCMPSRGAIAAQVRRKSQAGSQVSRTNVSWRTAREHEDSRLDSIRTDRHLARPVHILHVYTYELI